MLQFLQKSLIWTLPGTAACYGVWLGLLYINPSRDSIGLYRVMPNTCNAMIFGTSRSAQGVNPHILEEKAPSTGKWLNFSFNLAASPWNEAYAHAIEEKISCSLQSDLATTFLLFVDPWAVDENTGAGTDSWLSEEWSDVCDMSPFAFGKSKSNPLDVLGFGSGSDFLTVFANSLPRQLVFAIMGKSAFSANRGVQPDGWLPNRGVLTFDQKRKSIHSKVESYRQNKVVGTSWPASTNLNALEQCITFIQGNVTDARILLLRPPTAVEMRKLEDEWFPEANQEFGKIAEELHVEFFDMHHEWKARNNHHFNDGHHMCIEGANAFSAFLATELLMKKTHP